MKPRLTSEYGKLKKIIVHTPGAEHHQLIPWEGDHALMGPDPRAYRELQKNHKDLKDFVIAEAGKENVLEVSDLLYDIFDNTDGKQRYKILKDMLDKTADPYVDHLQSRGIKLEDRESEKLVRDMIHGYPRALILNNGKLPQLIIPPKRELMWMRDASAVTQVGVVINAMKHPRRMYEPTLMRTIFKYHPMFDPDSIFLDLVDFNRELKSDPSLSGVPYRYLMEGGNILVLDEETLAVGVGKSQFMYSDRTTRLGFYKLVEKIFEADTANKIRRIYMVNVPDLRGFIHLDTVFNMYGPKSAIAMPYIFGYPKPSINISAREVLQGFVKWLRSDMGRFQTDLSRIPTETHFEQAGKCEVYDRDYIKKIGKIERLPQKAQYFFDQLIKDGLLDLNNVTWIAGDPDNFANEFDHLRAALFEQHNMAGNVFATAPFRAVAYHRNPTTVQALREKMESLSPNAKLAEMSSNEIRTDNGGPHCLTLPLLREE